MKTRLCCLGLLLALSGGVRAQEGDSYAAEMAAFDRADRLNPPPRGEIVFTGSSSFRLWTDLASYFPGHRIINRGFGGSQVEDVIRHADRVIFRYAPRQVVIYAGTNDLATGDKSPEEVANDFALLFRLIRARLPRCRITYVSINPAPARRLLMADMQRTNQRIQAFAATQRNASFVDSFPLFRNAQGQPRGEFFGPDSLHLNASGYRQWAPALEKYLVK